MTFDLAFIQTFLFTVLRISTPLVYATLAAVITKQAGLLNLAIESMMLSAALVGVMVSGATQSALIGVLIGLAASVGIALLIWYATFIMNCDLYLVCISMNTALVGGTVFVMYLATQQKANTIGVIASKSIGKWDIPLIEHIPVIGKIISGHNIMTYVAVLAVIFTWFLIYKTKTGLRIRSVGENPAAAESVGISPVKLYFTSFGLSGFLAGLGGLYMSMGLMSYFARDMLAGRGMIGVSAMRVANGAPVGSALFAMLFGVSDTIANYLQITGMPPQLVAMFPYAATILLMVALAVLQNYRYKKHLKLRAQAQSM
jgi:Uncharacterized ABC-type transport system, permease component